MIWMQITAGQGPAECAWAVAEVLGRLMAEATLTPGLKADVLECEPGQRAGTLLSVLISLEGEPAEAFAESWRGVIQWIARSPYRPEHKRKNWFVGVERFAPPEEAALHAADLRWETMRASGPGGQHVNRTESAVRVTHLPTGLQVAASEDRSQLRNRRLALARLTARLAERQQERHTAARQERWQSHRELARGNPKRVLKA